MQSIRTEGDERMPDLNDFYAFKTTTSGSGSGGSRNNNLSGGNGGGKGCVTTLIVFAVLGWVLFFISK